MLLLEQMLHHMPAERRDGDVILGAVGDGHVTPESLLAVVREEFPTAWTPEVFRTHVGGLIARMVDLGLLAAHRWEGRRVRYYIPDIQKEAQP